MSVRIQFRRDTEYNWSANNPTLAEGEMGLEKDTGRWKIGNGSDSWNVLPYSNSIFSGPSTITDSSAGNALKIIQTGSGNAFLVEDTSTPDSSPFVIDSSGNVGIGTATPSVLLEVSGDALFSGTLSSVTADVDTNTTQVATTEYVVSQGYLKGLDAEATYLAQTDAEATYLAQTDAEATYLAQTDAEATYLAQTDAETTYLAQTDAEATYLSQTDASTTYATKSEIQGISPVIHPMFSMI